MTNVAAFHDGSEADRTKRQAWVDDLALALNQGDNGTYVNFLTDEHSERVRSAYPGPTWNRLVEVKRQYDRTNLFRLNQNIPPNG
jgi:FAD/FMN-containing dehydrogenase